MNEIRHPDHLKSCRICLEKFTQNEKQILITNILKKQFLEFTNIELKLSDEYSIRICLKCKLNLQSFSTLRQEFVQKQQDLTEFVESKQHKSAEKLDMPEVKVKIEPLETAILDTVLSDYEENCYDDEDDGIDGNVKEESLKSDDDLPLSKYSKSKRTQELNEDGVAAIPFEFRLSKKYRRNIPRPFNCEHCSAAFETKKTLENHIMYNHSETISKEEIRRIKKRNREDRMRICPTCGLRVDQLNKHIKQFHQHIKRYFCDNCHYSAFKRFDMISHVLKHRKHVDKSFTCSACGTGFTRKCGLRQHLRDFHSNRGPFICNYCNKEFNTNTLMRKHIKWIHEDGSKTRCPDCDKEISALCLKKHLLRDPEALDQKFTCSECLKEFTNKRCLTYHQTTHQGRSFICEYPDCGKSYTSLNQLHSHQKRHTDQKHLSCPFEGCNKEYFKQQNLRLHIATVHDNSCRKNCPVKACTYSTGAYNYMRDHLFRHTELKADERRQFFLAIKQMNLVQ
ncbi:unnamed protein product [Chironomus riparius]|uniref:Uncharacterized protein n=1 Tax=Chironomus riparius TaxID=315576 RepID=A0A9N9S1Q9_9DIPT|nr:unnamed protein product [Chironomus riparius]